MAIAKKTSTNKKKLTSKSKSLVKHMENTTQYKTREKMISEAAYYISEQRDFEDGYALQDWLQAEKNVEEDINVRLFW
jgi:hypothetical protein